MSYEKECDYPNCMEPSSCCGRHRIRYNGNRNDLESVIKSMRKNVEFLQHETFLSKILCDVELAEYYMNRARAWENAIRRVEKLMKVNK